MLKAITFILDKTVSTIKEIQFLGWTGLLATIIGIISFMPIIYRIIMTHDTSNFTYTNLSLALVSNLLWIVFGINKNVTTSTISGALYLIIYGIIFAYKIMIQN